MNIPPEIARAQGRHGIKGASHGSKGGRPRLDLTDDERAQRRREQREASRRRKGIMPRVVLTREERRELDRREHIARFDAEYRRVWRKPPGEPLAGREFAARYPAFRAWVRSCRDWGRLLRSPVHFVREHLREVRRKEREEWLNAPDGGAQGNDPQPETRPRRKPPADGWDWIAPFIDPPDEPAPRVGRNQPCPCGSGRKSKKCCGR